MTVETVEGFSALNRGILYASLLLAPAHFVAGFDSTGLTSLGFHAFNWYNQFIWYNAVQSRQLHALSILPHYFNLIYAISYLGGIASGYIATGLLLGLGTGGVVILNNITAWKSWAHLQPKGYGEYQFFFFGWRTLNDGWHKFFLVWQVFDSLLTFMCVMAAFAIPLKMMISRTSKDKEKKKPSRLLDAMKTISNYKYIAIPCGAALMMIVAWPLVLWVELLIQRNHIESPTDWISVWLFIAQAGLLIIPSFGGYSFTLLKKICKRGND